ncbi:hypothetical protein FSP39_015338 [Pinctada imbricata]|uniref:BL00235/CARNS1 N-terminal domain-containing protein n=1 Tax=Pinctada imbricata TaxID=66713 RepID=A0AA88XNR4_PINIB|nr:hypothetical protein FSP39_015338 [Pinctada imbricata]
MLSSPVECMGILLEGARQCPGVMLLILSTSWISKERSRGDPNLFSLFVHKAVTFDTAGRTFLDVFDPPRKVTYFVNFFTDGCTDGQRKDGEPIERDLDCPTSDSLNLVQIIDDKVLTRILMAEAGMQYPETLAFTYNVQHRYPKSEFDDIVIIKLEKINGVQEQVQCQVRKYLNRVKTRVQQVVVKPSGIMYHGSMGVTFHFTGDEEHVVSAILGLLESMPENNGVLVEEFYAPYSGDQTESTLDITDLSFRLRSNVCRGLNDTPITTTLVCGVGNKNEPINGDNTQPQSFETTLHQMGLSAHETRLREEVISTSENVLRRIIEFEKGLTIQEKGGVGAQTDIIGIDFVIGQKNGVISPIGIEVNSHDCTINCQLFEFINPRLSGSSLRPLVETMVSRSQEFVLQGRTIVVLGSGGTSKRFIWPIAKSYGVQVVLIDEEGCDVNAKEMCSMFIPYDFSNHVDDIDHADAISEILQSHAVKADGCCTFWEDCVPLTARLCSVLGLMGTGVEGAINAKQKSRTQKILMKRTGDIPHFPRTYLYAGKTVQIKTRVDIPKHMPKFRMPCMLKLEYGSSAVGCQTCQEYRGMRK